MARNLATILGQSGATSDQIEAAYDRAIRLEHRWLRSYAREHKVAWLAEVGRPGDAIVILEQLIDEPWLQLADRARIDLHHAIRRLHAAGGSLREIAEALGLSHQRVHQIVDTEEGP